MIENFNNILVLAPHTDDGELGLGGTISRLMGGVKMLHTLPFQLLRNLYQRDSLKIF